MSKYCLLLAFVCGLTISSCSRPKKEHAIEETNSVVVMPAQENIKFPNVTVSKKNETLYLTGNQKNDNFVTLKGDVGCEYFIHNVSFGKRDTTYLLFVVYNTLEGGTLTSHQSEIFSATAMGGKFMFAQTSSDLGHYVPGFKDDESIKAKSFSNALAKIPFIWNYYTQVLLPEVKKNSSKN